MRRAHDRFQKETSLILHSPSAQEDRLYAALDRHAVSEGVRRQVHPVDRARAMIFEATFRVCMGAATCLVVYGLFSALLTWVRLGQKLLTSF